MVAVYSNFAHFCARRFAPKAQLTGCKSIDDCILALQSGRADVGGHRRDDRSDGPGGLFVAAGFSGHGFCLGPAVGKLMAEWILDGVPSLDLAAFSWRRFMRPEGPLSVIQGAPEQIG
jgi:FAD dependent oxidoreductase